MRDLETVLLTIAREDTGVHMCDSGGSDGRAWQRALKKTDKELFAEPEPDIDTNSINISRNAFKYLYGFLSISENSEYFNKCFKEFAKNKEDNPYLSIMEEFGEVHNQPDNYLCDSIKATNTYNFENVLNEVFQYVIFHNSNEYYIILQVHRGADVRGGYSVPQVFKLEDAESFFCRLTDLSASCASESFYSDDCGYHWYKNTDGSDIEFIVKNEKAYYKGEIVSFEQPEIL